MADIALEALDDMPWERLESTLGNHAVKELRRALRGLALKGEAAAEEDCYPLFDCLAVGTGRVASVATAALPFVVALAGNPGMGGRATLVQLLASLSKTAAEAEPGLVDVGWHEAWRRHRPRIRALLADPRPEVRREALPLVEGVGVLLERWRAETDPAVRLPVLLALGTAAARPADAGTVDRVRAVVAEVLRTDAPVMRVAAVHAWAAFDPQAPVRELDVLVEVLSDRAVRPQFEAIWYVPDVDSAFTREDVVSWAAHLFEGAPRTALSFVVRLIHAARRNGDTLLCRAALDEGWRLLVVRPSAASALLPLASALLADPDDGVRYRAAHLLAVLGSRAAPYADELAALLDDPGEAEFFEGTVDDHACWALTRIGDPRALPGLVERLYAPYRGQYSRGYTMGDPRLPEVEDVLTPLRAHAEVLLPAVRQLLRDDGVGGSLTCPFLRVLKAWGPAAAPALPEVVALLDDARYTLYAVDALVAMGPAAAPAEPAVRRCTVSDFPGNHHMVAWAAWRLGGDLDAALRLIGEAVLTEEGPLYGPVGLLGDFGPAAALCADRVRHVMEHGDTWLRLRAAVALWSITGEPEPSASVLEECLPPIANGGDAYGYFLDALRALARIGTISPAARTILRTVQESDRRLSTYRDYRAFLQDEEIRSAIDDVLTLP
ncbi:HEAT repeat domain-containing protein [Streptomyces sp. NBC_01224]|uniref:HEAT repeat domain-containing protein n=1 Tax=Streptomyces sp. NBC_01224 TaxID=2903783 RepID=UPI002E1344CC|nr:HEAT repeat domain-containing protein [Streptomyces sp. NBC_01224]